MAATDRQWDIVSSIGLTALGVAAARAVETNSPEPLIDDPFAAEFVRAAAPPRPLPTEPVEDELWTAMTGYMALRSQFFDAVVTGSDTPQVVILAAGLDARAYRLDLTGRDVYEVDQPRVLEFKQQVLDRLRAEPRCRRHPVAADLREDWPAALELAGFDRTRPTTWLAEGLLPYLPAHAEEQLFDLVHARSAPGSRIGVEQFATSHLESVTNSMQALDAGERLGVNISQLFSGDPRRDPITWLAEQGWQVEVDHPDELADRFGRQLPDLLVDTMAKAELVRADLP
ncbi:class I SAM-dependent methyltransferase [Amycolatopsis ultiminotia]|uniref:S-adenosyl-L-methionine-dependent methyltransferase n=1 Tax=Amycolatopsis ultiminotia TaxID=543629 RepID=A0ABP6VEF2_9PSEU